MNKTDFIGEVAKKAACSKVDAKKAVNAFLETVTEALENGERIVLLGLGTFKVVEKAARLGINPKTQEKITIPARKVIRFKPGASLAKAAK